MSQFAPGELVKTAALNHSATSPMNSVLLLAAGFAVEARRLPAIARRLDPPPAPLDPPFVARTYRRTTAEGQG
ncbi:hypothetical protein SVA_1977 [Sulfurifustis variabilis]|uniref:Uncharacterized protein n=1 Tax=Sulfurifustis variabilis TaxID=1675686 RepID=A0A1B4V4S7_9GAMM|nr:hypothetical protein SVA_1977 [Sulfurifustis variabilis]